MSYLHSIRTNIFYLKKDKKNKEDADEFEKVHEIIFLVSSPTYKQTNNREVIQEKTISELRMNVLGKDYDSLIKNLAILKDIDDNV